MAFTETGREREGSVGLNGDLDVTNFLSSCTVVGAGAFFAGVGAFVGGVGDVAVFAAEGAVFGLVLLTVAFTDTGRECEGSAGLNGGLDVTSFLAGCTVVGAGDFFAGVGDEGADHGRLFAPFNTNALGLTYGIFFAGGPAGDCAGPGIADCDAGRDFIDGIFMFPS